MKIPIGKVGKEVGLKGKFRVNLYTKGSDTLKEINEISVKDLSGKFESYEVESVSVTFTHALLKLKELSSVNDALKFKGKEIFIDSDNLKQAQEGEYYHYQLIGCKVFNESGKSLGVVKDIFPTGANDVFVVKRGSKEYLVPFTEDIFKKIDLDKKEIILSSLKGLFDD